MCHAPMPTRNEVKKLKKSGCETEKKDDSTPQLPTPKPVSKRTWSRVKLLHLRQCCSFHTARPSVRVMLKHLHFETRTECTKKSRNSQDETWKLETVIHGREEAPRRKLRNTTLVDTDAALTKTRMHADLLVHAADNAQSARRSALWRHNSHIHRHILFSATQSVHRLQRWTSWRSWTLLQSRSSSAPAACRSSNWTIWRSLSCRASRCSASTVTTSGKAVTVTGRDDGPSHCVSGAPVTLGHVVPKNRELQRYASTFRTPLSAKKGSPKCSKRLSQKQK